MRIGNCIPVFTVVGHTFLSEFLVHTLFAVKDVFPKCLKPVFQQYRSKF